MMADRKEALQRVERARRIEVRQVWQEFLQAPHTDRHKRSQEDGMSIELLMESGKVRGLESDLALVKTGKGCTGSTNYGGTI